MHPINPAGLVHGMLFLGMSLLAPLPATLQARGLSDASVTDSSALSGLSGTVVAGSTALLAEGAVLVIEAVETGGEFVVLVLRDASQKASLSVRLSTSQAGDLSEAIGQSVRVAVESTGYSLYLAGRLLVFIPNEVGRSLLYHAPLVPADKP